MHNGIRPKVAPEVHWVVQVLHLPGALDLAAMDKVGDKMARSALAELVQPHSRLVDGDVESALNLSRWETCKCGCTALLLPG